MNITCIRWNKTGEIPSPKHMDTLVRVIERKLKLKGYSAYVEKKNKCRIYIAGSILLTDNFKAKFGRNLNEFSGRKSSHLSWDNYLVVNQTLNELLDAYGISANITSLKGKFVIRRGMTTYTDSDWELLRWENVGSWMQPVRRDEQYPNENGYSHADFDQYVDESVMYKMELGL